MPEQQLIGSNLAEDLITLLCHSDTHGKLVAGMVDHALFPGDYAMIAERAINYWKEYKEAPKQHTANLIAPELEEGGRRSEHLRRTLINMDQVHDNLNATFVLNQITRFVRLQRLSDGVLRAAQLISSHGGPAEIEHLLDGVLRSLAARFDSGTRLDDDLEPFLEYLDTQHSEFVTGIVELDKRGIVPARGEVMLLVAGKGRGKSWFLVNIGRENLWHNKRVLHVSLEMSEMEVRQRYYQCLFSAPKHNYAEVGVPYMERTCSICHKPSGLCRCNPVMQRLSVSAIPTAKVKPKFTFKSPELRTELETRLTLLGAQTSNLIIKRFPNRSLTVDASPPIWISGRRPRSLRARHRLPRFALPRAERAHGTGLAQHRKAEHGFPRRHRTHPGDRRSIDPPGTEGTARRPRRRGPSQVHTADTTLIHLLTEEEQLHAHPHLVDHARAEQDRAEVFIVQSLTTGPCLDSVRKPSNYDELLKEAGIAQIEETPVDDPDQEDDAPISLEEPLEA